MKVKLYSPNIQSFLFDSNTIDNSQYDNIIISCGYDLTNQFPIHKEPYSDIRMSFKDKDDFISYLTNCQVQFIVPYFSKREFKVPTRYEGLSLQTLSYCCAANLTITNFDFLNDGFVSGNTVCCRIISDLYHCIKYGIPVFKSIYSNTDELKNWYGSELKKQHANVHLLFNYFPLLDNCYIELLRRYDEFRQKLS